MVEITPAESLSKRAKGKFWKWKMGLLAGSPCGRWERVGGKPRELDADCNKPLTLG